MPEPEPPFEMQVDIEVPRQPPFVWPAGKKAFFVHGAEREAGAVFDEVGSVGVARQDAQERRQSALRQRSPSPGDEAMRRVPRKRTATLLGENRILEAEVNHGVRTRVGPHITCVPLKSPPERAPHGKFEGIVPVATPIAQVVVLHLPDAGRLRAPEVDQFREERQPAIAAAAQVSHLAEQAAGQRAFEAEARGPVARHAQELLFHEEGRFDRATPHQAVRREERRNGDLVLVPADQRQTERVMKDTYGGRDLGAPQPSRRPGDAEARRGEHVAHHLVPVEAEARVDQQSVARRPAVRDVLGEFKVAPGGAARARKRHFAGHTLVLAQNPVRVPVRLLPVRSALQIHAELELMRAPRRADAGE